MRLVLDLASLHAVELNGRIQDRHIVCDVVSAKAGARNIGTLIIFKEECSVIYQRYLSEGDGRNDVKSTLLVDCTNTSTPFNIEYREACNFPVANTEWESAARVVEARAIAC